MIGVIVAAAMAASFFLPWVSFFGTEFGPMSLLDPQEGIEISLNWRAWAFLGSFGIAALAAVMAVMQRAAGFFMFVAGAIPFALVGEQALSAREQIQDLGLPLPQGGNPAEAFDMVREFIDIGAPMYVISAALLVVIGLVRMMRGA